MTKVFNIVIVVFIILLGTGVSLPLAAVDYPTRPIELVIPYPPGGMCDSCTMPFKDKAAKIIGQPILSVYKAGAGGGIGTAYTANAAPDGYTVVSAYEPNLIYLPLTKDAGYTLDSFTPVCNLTEGRVFFLVKENSPYKTMRDFVEAARTKKMIYASAGAYTSGHIVMELLARRLGIQFIHIPYSGGSTAFTAVLGGHADIGVAGGSLGMIGPGKLRAIAVTGDERFPISPDVPTMVEFGYPTLRSNLVGLWAPKGTPKEIIQKLYQAMRRVGEENRMELNAILKGAEQTVRIVGPEELAREYKDTNEFYRKFLGEMGWLRK